MTFLTNPLCITIISYHTLVYILLYGVVNFPIFPVFPSWAVSIDGNVKNEKTRFVYSHNIIRSSNINKIIVNSSLVFIAPTLSVLQIWVLIIIINYITSWCRYGGLVQVIGAHYTFLYWVRPQVQLVRVIVFENVRSFSKYCTSSRHRIQREISEKYLSFIPYSCL